MFTDKNYNTLSNDVYNYDVDLGRTHTQAGQIDRSKTYFVIDSVDNNSNGLQAIAVAPLKNGKPDYSNITLSYAGTGDSAGSTAPNNAVGKDANDIEQDLEGMGQGHRNTLEVKNPKTGATNTVDSQFKSATDFANKIKKEYPNAIFNTTGHSLGGAIALVVASHFKINATVFSAPDPWKAMTTKEKMWALANPDKLINYRHHNDALSSWDSIAMGNAGFTGTTVWSYSTKEGDPIGTHGLETYKFKNGKTVVSKKQSADIALYSDKLSAIKDLYKSLKKSGGKLTSGEKIFLDSIEAVALSSSLTKIAIDGLDEIIGEYKKSMKELTELWNNGVKQAQTMGQHLSHSEVISALARGGATKQSIVTDPSEEMFQKMQKAENMKSDYRTLENNLKSAVEKKMQDDNELARGFNF